MLCCTPQRTKKENPPPVVTRSRTTMQVHTLEHFWTIENFSKCHQREANYIDSAPFYADPAYMFFMRLYPMGDIDDGTRNAKKFMSIFLNFRSDDDSKIAAATVGCKFSLVNRYGVKSFDMEFKHKIASGSGWGWRKFLKRSAVVDCCAITKNLLPGFAPNDELTIHCEVTYVTNIETDPAPLVAIGSAPKPVVSKSVEKKALVLPTKVEVGNEQELKKATSQESLDTLQSYGTSGGEEAPEEEEDAKRE